MPARGEVDGLALSPDNRFVASRHRDGALRLWDLRNQRVPQNVRGHEVGVADLLFSADGMTLVSASQTGIIRAWSVNHHRLFGVLFDPAWEETNAGRCRLGPSGQGIFYPSAIRMFPMTSLTCCCGVRSSFRFSISVGNAQHAVPGVGLSESSPNCQRVQSYL